MAQHPVLDIQVAFCSLQGAEPGIDPEFGVEINCEKRLLEGYPWVLVQNRSPRPGLRRFFGLLNPGLWDLIRSGGFDAVAVFTGYMYASFWITAAAAKVYRKPLLFGTDITTLRPLDEKAWKARLKPVLAPLIFRMTDVLGVGSTAGQDLMRGLGIPEERIVLTPFVVNNDWWTDQALYVDRAAVRQKWGVPADSPVVLFCAKLQPWKRPLDLLSAFARANVAQAYLVYAGEGPLRKQLEAEALALGVADRVRMLGFVNHSQLPEIYCAGDVLVVPSEQDACPVVVCEAMLCGTPVVLSDEVKGRFELVTHGKTGFIYPCGNIEELAALLRQALEDRERLRLLGVAARQRMETWSPHENVEAWAGAFETAVRLRGARNRR
jgi:glycosyltransferase involved in cell wall biosynthesis